MSETNFWVMHPVGVEGRIDISIAGLLCGSQLLHLTKSPYYSYYGMSVSTESNVQPLALHGSDLTCAVPRLLTQNSLPYLFYGGHDFSLSLTC